MRAFPPVIVTAAVLLTAVTPQAPLRDAVSFAPAHDAALVVPRAYELLSPLYRTLDVLATLSLGQHAALLLTIAAGYVVWRRRTRRRQTTTHRLNEWWRGVLAVSVLAGLYLLAVVAPRPMVQLTALSPDELRVDFHSHTNASHDARKSFDIARRRAWHRDAGFDVAWVSDHRAFLRAAVTANPARAGDSLVLLPAYEGRYRGLFVVMLGLSAADSALVDRRRHLRHGALTSGDLPVSIAALPGPLDIDVPLAAPDSPPRLRGLQLWDGSPRAWMQGQWQRDQLTTLASRHSLALVSGTNHHGWGRSPVTWTLVRLPGWRDLTPDSLGAELMTLLRNGRHERLRVVERRRPDPSGSVPLLALTAPAALWDTLTTLTPVERVAWIAWAWLAAVAVRVARRRWT